MNEFRHFDDVARIHFDKAIDNASPFRIARIETPRAIGAVLHQATIAQVGEQSRGGRLVDVEAGCEVSGIPPSRGIGAQQQQRLEMRHRLDYGQQESPDIGGDVGCGHVS